MNTDKPKQSDIDTDIINPAGQSSKKTLIIKILSVSFMIVIPIILFYTMEWFLRNPFEKMLIPIQLLNIAFFELFALLLFFVTRSVRRALRIEAVIALLIGLINYFVVQFRSNPVMPWDLFSIKTAASVADNYKYSLETHAIVCVVVFAIMIIICQLAPVKAGLKIKARIAGALISLFLLILLGNYTQTQACIRHFRLYDKLFTPNTMTYRDGTVVAFLMQCQYLSVDEPDSYDKETAESLLADVEAKVSHTTTSADEELPNIIVIMDEAFSDLSILDDYTTNEDEMPFVRSLMAGSSDTVSGYMDVSIVGGNTANTEFEFLTGDSMAFLPQGSIPYQQYIHEQTDSMATSLKELGYRTIAMHPYNASGWDRNEVYEYFGFDAFYSRKDYKNPEILRKYVSDQADFEKIIEVYEQDPDTPLFLFNVTMQNHSSYTEEFDNFTPLVEVEGSDSFPLNQYLSLLQESDRALEQLIHYFDENNDPTIIVFFGDHQPTDSVVSPIYKLNDRSVYNLTEEELRLRYQVPYIIHANYDIEEAQHVPMSSNYLGVKTLDIAGLPLTNYQQFLLNQYETYPSISFMQITDADGNVSSIGEEDPRLHSYQILQYYHLFEE